MEIFFASGNEHKRAEMERLFGEKIKLPEDEGIIFDPIENGDTFIENALIKANTLYELTGKPVLADDSGLCVEALGGRPGIFTSRYGCSDAVHLNSKEQYTLLLKELEGEENRKAYFICALVFQLSKHQIYIVQEKVDGYIALSPYGKGGFGYDPVFLVEELGITAAELPPSKKDWYSHRGRAVRKLKVLLGDSNEAK